MILYTVLPDESVMEDENEFDEYLNSQRFIEYDGRHLIIEPISEQEWKIVRLISSNPQDYLNEHFQPGKAIPIKPQFQL